MQSRVHAESLRGNCLQWHGEAEPENWRRGGDDLRWYLPSAQRKRGGQSASPLPACTWHGSQIVASRRRNLRAAREYLAMPEYRAVPPSHLASTIFLPQGGLDSLHLLLPCSSSTIIPLSASAPSSSPGRTRSPLDPARCYMRALFPLPSAPGCRRLRQQPWRLPWKRPCTVTARRRRSRIGPSSSSPA